jgi:hypothetical protein
MKHLKNITKKLLIALCIATALWTSLAIAEGGPGGQLLPDVLTPPATSKINLVKQLPNGTWQQIIGSVINMVLAIAGSLAFISFTVGGVMMVTAQGVEDKIRKGKSIFTWSLIALVIIGTSFGIVLGITQLKFFQ